ncbi:predicted protein [Nematostella vectensis]|uniref:DNA 3'-5' helicase n=1 Tax=Nematostella vectensis TaxID=45351 RepID=A7RM66_NEMVE|nr:predicted protein [Nematostella vectensis]|eukprot:XP_001639513.1 predicted protein [Nematostella vectensis]
MSYYENDHIYLYGSLFSFFDRGTSSTNKMVAFRTIYSELHELRTLAAGAKVIALTATATMSTKETITDVLRMQDVIEMKIPIRRTLPYIVKYLSNSMDAKESFEWLVNKINERKDGGDKTIIYCQTIKQCSLVYGTLRSMLIELVANGKPKLEMLHSCTPKENKDAILESFKRLDGHVQVLVATIAFGMGIDCKGIASEEKRRSVSEDHKKELSRLLKKYHKKLLMDVTDKIEIWNICHAREIVVMLAEVFNDIDVSCEQMVDMRLGTSDGELDDEVIGEWAALAEDEELFALRADN